MKIAIYGAGAIGAWLGAALSRAGKDVTLIARGEHLAAMQANGVTVESGDDSYTAYPRCVEDPCDAGEQDHVIVTLKAYSLPGITQSIQPLLGSGTSVVTGVNGIPWWYFYQLKGPWENRQLESVDPGGAFWNAVGPERAIGCVIYPASMITQPGVIRVIEGDRYALGEPDGSRSERCLNLCAALQEAGFKARVRDNIRDDIWIKLWGNLCFNPVSALTLATLDRIAGEAGTREVCRRMMLEAQGIGEKLGARFRVDVERRLDGGAAVGAHKTSMLQDLESGRPMEIDALLGVVQELGQLVELPTPTIDVVLALIRLRAESVPSQE